MVARKCSVNKIRLGVSDLIIVLALIAVAIPVTLAVQNWLSSQVSKAYGYSVAPELVANIVAMDYRNNNVTMVLSLANKGGKDLDLSNHVNATIVFEDGGTINTSATRISGKSILSPGDEATLLITLPNITSRISVVILEVKDILGNNYVVKVVVK